MFIVPNERIFCLSYTMRIYKNEKYYKTLQCKWAVNFLRKKYNNVEGFVVFVFRSFVEQLSYRRLLLEGIDNSILIKYDNSIIWKKIRIYFKSVRFWMTHTPIAINYYCILIFCLIKRSIRNNN